MGGVFHWLDAMNLEDNFLLDRIMSYREGTFYLYPGHAIKTKNQAVDFVNRNGYIFFWPNKGISLPSLWTAVAGDRPVADEHDDPGHVTWGWKDAMLGKKIWYYGRILRRRNTIVSLEKIPYFYALTENYGDPDEDYLIQYEQGRMTREAKIVYEALLQQGPLDTIALRKITHLTSKESDSRFNRALEDLQIDLKILPVGVSEAGAWHYAFIYDLVPHHFPEIQEQARFITEDAARRELVLLYFKMMGGAEFRDLTRLFGWKIEVVEKTIQQLTHANILTRGINIPSSKWEWITLSSWWNEVS